VPAFECFKEQKIYLVSQAADDLNFTFVLDEHQTTISSDNFMSY
jgi:hypothetical protein